MYCDAYFDKNKMWYFDKELPALCEIDFETHNMRVLANYYGKNNIQPHKVFCVNQVLFVTFLDATRIWKFDMDKEILQEFIDDISFVDDCDKPYVFTVLVDDRIWFIPRYKTASMCYFDLSKELFFVNDKLQRKIGMYEKKDEIPIVSLSEYGTQLWAVLWNTNQYLKYDFHSGELELFELKNSNIHLNSICYDGESVWLTQTDNTNLICVDAKGNIVSIKIGDKKTEEQYSRIMNLNDDIIVLPRFGDTIILVCKKTREIREVEISRKFLSEDKLKKGYSKILGCHETQEKIYLFPWGIADLLFVNKEEMKIEKVKINNEVKMYREYMDGLLKDGMNFKESWHIGLSQYIEWVLACQGQMNSGKLSNKHSIFHAIVDMID